MNSVLWGYFYSLLNVNKLRIISGVMLFKTSSCSFSKVFFAYRNIFLRWDQMLAIKLETIYCPKSVRYDFYPVAHFGRVTNLMKIEYLTFQNVYKKSVFKLTVAMKMCYMFIYYFLYANLGRIHPLRFKRLKVRNVSGESFFNYVTRLCGLLKVWMWTYH